MIPNNDTNLSNETRNRYEQRIQKKVTHEAEMRKTRYKKISKKIFYWLIGIIIIFVGGWLLIKSSSPKGSDFSQAVDILGRDHISYGIEFDGYNSNPPTSGSHYPKAADIGFYSTELSDEQLVHNLEHGHIWIAYKSDLSNEVIKQLEKFVGGNVIVTPRSKNDTDIAVAAWGRLDKFNIESAELDNQRIKDFILRYQNKGPEKL